MTMARMAVFEASLRTDCAAANLATTFDVKKHVRAFKAVDSASDVDQQVLATNLWASSSSHTLSSTCSVRLVEVDVTVTVELLRVATVLVVGVDVVVKRAVKGRNDDRKAPAHGYLMSLQK